MSTAKHTRGRTVIVFTQTQLRKANLEWQLRGVQSTNDCIGELAEAFDQRVYDEDEARLIAAAPDMLEDLQDALLALEANWVEPKLQATIRKTIAKATGADTA